MKTETKTLAVNGERLSMWLPWWFRPSQLLLFASLPAVLLFSLAPHSMSESKAQPLYGTADMVVGILTVFVLAAAAMLGESRLVPDVWNSLIGKKPKGQMPFQMPDRIPEALLSTKVDLFLMGVFVVAHLIFFRGFFTNPGLVAGVLGGNLELKHTFETIPGVTTWTQVSLVLGALRGLRWAGVLPGKVKLISVFHIVFFGTLFIRAILWSERLALIEGVVPFFVCAMPRIARSIGPGLRVLLRLFPLIVPILLLVVFTAFEALRSWQSNTAEYSNIFVFGWKRLFTYYYEALNTGAAILQVSGFYDGLTMPMGKAAYEQIYEGLYQGTLDIEFNNASGIWHLVVLAGNVFLLPNLLVLGYFMGATYRYFREGKLFGLFFPIIFLEIVEILRIHYWVGENRVLPSTIVILLILAWSLTVKGRVRMGTMQKDEPSISTTPRYATAGH